MQIHGSMLALHTNRPVKMVYDRQESFTGHVHRHPARIWCEHRATREGRLTCVRMRILLDGGAYASSSTAVASNAASLRARAVPRRQRADRVDRRLHEQPAVRRDARLRRRADLLRGARRRWTSLAAELGIDPVELRLLNALEPGDVLPTGQVVTGSLPTRDVIRRTAALPFPRRRRCRATRSASRAARATRRRARASAAASASRSGSRTSATRRASTTSAPRASCSTPTAAPSSTRPRPRSARASSA